ncbi:hypothetical protein MKW94_029099 [Papaver nudicaule]|uniref:Phytocyanin domain-containing protein n=1 Tax=Papaver nudicaule TaxID=74823 RepID=A0AA41VPF0_PAPNU|nr:hypothetical protein [Papaver nudicaule]MCL7045021.1 hypothetical protein [Papaver nudicaule]
MMMKQRNTSPLIFIFSIISIFCLSDLISRSVLVVEAATNHTVGGSLGWYDNLKKPDVNYQKWVSGKDFSLGDFLIFNTDSNHSVVQTYNVSTYKRCNYDDAEDDDTTQWSSADPSSTAPVPVTVAIPLVKEGMTYFFSSDYDGEQCKHGQHFKINVAHGSGLPPSMKTPDASEPSPAPTKSTSGDDDDADESTPNPDTVVSSNFNNPKQSTGTSADDADTKEKSGSVSVTKRGSFLDMKMVTGVIVLVILGRF